MFNRDHKVLAVFATSGAACDLAVRHLRAGAPGLPIFAFSREAPSPETAAVCELIRTGSRAFPLALNAARELRSRWVSLAVVTWIKDRGSWSLKLAPFLRPPFRVLVLNEHDGFFAGTPGPVILHVWRRIADRATSTWRRVRDVHRGFWLFAFAFIAQWFGFVSRFAFARLPKTKRLEIAVEPATGTDAVVFEYVNREWDWRAIENLAAGTDARWLVFHEKRVQPAFQDLLPLFEDRRTFAVSRQTGYRGWRKLLFATAPFRALQPGEAARVVAPVSGLIVVDRLKLLALGVPRTMAFGSAWLLLFWKAAAAGWSSYSASAEAQGVTELPDMSFEEAEFVKNVLGDPALKPLGPRETDLARGSIAFSIGGVRPFRGLPRVLVVSPYLPWPLSHGGAVRIWNLCQALSDRVDFLLACFRENEDRVNYAKLHQVFRAVHVVDIDEKHVNQTLPRQVNEYESRSLRALINSLKFDVLQIEYTQLAGYRSAAPEVPAILVEHDLTFTLHQQFAEHEKTSAARLEYERWLRFERAAFRQFDVVWTMSDQDRARAIQEGSAPERTVCVPNGVDIERFRPMPNPSRAIEILYVGSFRHRPNRIGFEHLRDVVMPIVWKQFPGARLRVVAGPGAAGPGAACEAADRCQIHGFVEDLRPLYASATLVAVPLLISAGTNIKVMEALACGRAVASTPAGCQGLELVDGYDAVIREPGAPFARVICELIANPAARGEIARHGRQTAEDRCSWRGIAERAYAGYAQVNAGCRSGPSPPS